MMFKNSLVTVPLLLGVILSSVSAYPEYDDGQSSGIQMDNAHNNDKNKRNNNNNNSDDDYDEIYNRAASQQEIEANERNLEFLPNMDIDMDMVAKTEVTLKNVRNISNNQLSNEYISIEHDDDHIVGMAEEVDEDNNNTFTQTTEHNIKEIDTENLLNKKDRMARKHFSSTTTTTVPQYIKKIDEIKKIPLRKDVNVSIYDYEEEETVAHQQKKNTTKSLDNSSEESEEIVPLAMKYYDQISRKNSQTEKISSEDYYEDEYTELEIPTTLQPPDNSILRTLSAGFPMITPTKSTPTIMPLTTTWASKIPLNDQLTTLSPPQTIFSMTTTRIASAAAAAAADVSSVSSSDKKGKQIPIISTVPVVTTTTTKTTRRRLLPHEQLRNYIEDAYIRMPLAVIVDASAGSLENTKALWNEALRTDLNIKIILVTLNEPEQSPAAFNFNNTRQFLAGLNSIKEQNGVDAFRGILDAAELVPYDSAVFISTARLAQHTDHLQDSAITLLKKRIRLYLIWFGERSLSENETQDSIGGILGELAIRSGGEILHVVSTENSQELEGSTLTIVADALRGSQEVEVPVDTMLSSLHVKIDKHMRRAVLDTPNGG